MQSEQEKTDHETDESGRGRGRYMQCSKAISGRGIRDEGARSKKKQANRKPDAFFLNTSCKDRPITINTTRTDGQESPNVDAGQP
jgi:hypothetical protein